MPSSIRIAFTFFISATVLMLLVRQRAIKLQNDLQNLTGEVAEELARDETRMLAIGLILAGALALGGFVLIIVGIAKSRRKKLPRNDG
ncbi:MAG: hypothetical protein ACPG4K_06495 [Haloferula sp.]